MLACAGTAFAAAALTPAPAGAADDPALAGGTSATPKPVLRTLRCRTDCTGLVHGRPGSLIVLRGRALDTVEKVTFVGARGSRDDVSVDPEKVGSRSVSVRVPRRAVSGPLTVTNADGVRSRRSRARVRIVDIKTREVERGDGGPGLELAVTGKKVFFDGDRQPAVTFVVRDSAPVRVLVEVVRVGDGAVVAKLDQGEVAPDQPRTVTWNGRVGAAAAPDGRYEFRVSAIAASGAKATSSQSRSPGSGPDDAPASPDSFLLVGHKFPIRGKHHYGEFAATYGGGRDHKGQDVFAKCGTPLVAARGGTVKIKKFQSRAGHYVVIDGEQTDVDYAYMHLQSEAVVGRGDRVRTGELIGYVGDTGRASGCHLHFEMWSGPGWYTGGSPFDPLPHLRAWDKFS